MAVQSNASNNRIASPTTVAGASGPFFATWFYKAVADPTTTPNDAIFSWENAGGTYRIRQIWNESNPGKAKMLYKPAGGAVEVTSMPLSGYGTTNFHHFGIGYNGTSYLSYYDGALQNTNAGSAPASGQTAAIAIMADVFGDASPGGQWAQLAVWSGRALQDPEIAYLAAGGSPMNLTSAGALAMVEHLPLSSDSVDIGPNAYTQTVTGSPTFVTDPTLLAATLPKLRTPRKFLMSSFRGPEGSGVASFSFYLFDGTDYTGTAYQYRPMYCAPPGGHVIHDPSVFYVKNTIWPAREGELWFFSISVNGGAESTFDAYRVNTDEVSATFMTSVDTSSVVGSSGTARTFKPTMFRDDDGSVHILFGGSSDSLVTMRCYETHPMNSDWTVWSKPVALSGVGLPALCYDFHMVKHQGVYYVFYSDISGGGYVCIMSSRNMLSGYTIQRSGDWAGWGTNNEGTTVVKRDDGTWIITLDFNFGNGTKYATTTGFNFATASSLANTILNGLGSVAPNFVAQGPSVIRIPDPKQVYRRSASILPFVRNHPAAAIGGVTSRMMLAAA